MNDWMIILLLLSAPGLPLLLAIPALHCRLRWPVPIALSPAIGLLFVPGDFAIELPWVLLGSAGMGIDTLSRWWLLMSVTIWAVSATFLHRATEPVADNRLTTLFLLTLAGQLGTVLATNLVSFFAYMTLMGYAFVGLLLIDGNDKARSAGRCYLVLLIIADIALFEALLIAGGLTDDLGFATVARVISQSPSSTFYLSMVVTGFALKAGFWPLQVWLPLAFSPSRPAVALLLWIVPVATGLLGMVRWIPLGAIVAPMLGTLLLGIGAAGIFYALLFGLMRAQWKQLPLYVVILATGVFAMGLGIGMVDPAIWNQYGDDSAPVFVTAVGLGFAVIIAGLAWVERKNGSPSELTAVAGTVAWFEYWPQAVIRWAGRTGFNTLPGLRAAWLAKWARLLQTDRWQKVFDAGEYFIQHWPFAVTLSLLLGMLSVVLLLLDVMSVL